MEKDPPPPSSSLSSMDQITIKTPNPKCRCVVLWCLIEFIDWRYNQSGWYFLPLLWTSAPLTFSLVYLPSPSFPLWINTGVCILIYTMCRGGGGRVVWRAYTGVIHCVFDQIPNLQNRFTPPPPPQQKPRLGGGLRQIKTCRQDTSQVNFKENRHLGLESISYLVHVLSQLEGRGQARAVVLTTNSPNLLA